MADKSMEDMDANDFMAAWLRKKEAATSTSSPDLGEIKEILSNLLTGQEEIRARLDTIESQGREKLATDDIICDGVRAMENAAAEVSGRTRDITAGVKSWEGKVAKAVESMEAGMQGAMAKTSKGFEDKINGDLADFDKMLKGNLAAGDKMRKGIDQVGRSWEGKLTTAVESMEAGLRSAVTETSKDFQGKIKGKLANYDKLLKDMEKTASGFDLDGKLAGIKEDIKKIAKKAEEEAAEAERVAGENKRKRKEELLQMGPGALFDAADRGDTNIVRELLAAGMDPDRRELGETPVYRAALKGHFGVVKLLVGANANVLPDVLVDAAEKGYAKIVRELLAAGVDVNHTKERDERRTALYKAAIEGHLEAAQVLIDAGADVDKGPYNGGERFFINGGRREPLPPTPLSAAAQGNHPQVARALIDAGADVGPHLLVDAAEKGDAKVVQVLIAGGADVNHTKKGDRRTALWCAACHGHLEAAQALINAGADVDKKASSPFGEGTPLTIAAHNGHLEVVKALVDAKADVNKSFDPRSFNPNLRNHHPHESVVEYLKSVGAQNKYHATTGHFHWRMC